MRLFILKNWELVISDEVLLISTFKRIVDRDKNPNKINAIKELGFIYFFLDPRSEYTYLVDLEERKNKIKQQSGLSNTWEPDSYILEAMEVYKDLINTTASLLLQDTKLAVDKVRVFLRDLDLNATDDKGKPLYTIQSIVSAIEKIPKLATDLVVTEKLVAKEIEENSRVRGQKIKSILEDDIGALHAKK